MANANKHVDKYIFYACLALAAGLYIGSFFCPPVGSIDASVLKAGATLLGFAALGIVGQNLANGKAVTFSHADTEVTIDDGDDKQNENSITVKS